MIVKDIRYIIKRIIIGVGIALVLMLIKGNLMLSVNARTISSYSIGNTVAVVDNLSSGYSVSVNGSPWAGYGDGYLYVNFSLFKVSGASTDPNVGVRTVKVFVGSASYTCSYGSNTSNNSTFVNSSYSAVCPVYLDSNGISSIWVGLQDNQQNSLSQYRLTFDSNITFEQKSPENDYNSILGSINANANANAGYTQNAINSASSSITNNQNQNSQAIINNQNQIAQQQQENQKVCVNLTIDNDYVTQMGKYLNSSGDFSSNDSYGVTDFLSVDGDIKPLKTVGGLAYYCFYDNSYSLVSCFHNNTMHVGSFLTIPNNAKYVRFSIYQPTNIPVLEMKSCKNGNQALADQNQQLQNTLNDTSTTQADSDASNFFSNFSSNSHGLSGIISAPLRLIQSISSSTCSPLVVPLPFVNESVSLPCMSTIYTTYFNTFLVLYRLITTGLIGYWVCIRLFSKVKDFQNPDNDRIEVLDL